MELNKQNEKLLQELLKKYKQGIISGLYPGNNITFTPTVCRDKIISSTSSGIGGGIQSIQEGDNITIDNTDPLNPIVSASGGGSSTLFPNGIEFVNASRDFQASDAGKRLFITGENTVISMPEVNPFAVGDYVGIINNGTNISFTTEYGGEPIFSLKTGDGSTSECVILMNTEIEGSSWLFPISTSFKYDETDSLAKTALRYLYDQSQNAIPLSGEVTGSTSLSAIDKTAITNKTTETIVGTDYVLFGDTSDGDNLKKGLVSDIVALSGGGGGSPAGSDTQIQINQSGAFFADSTFQKSDTDFNVGLDHTQQSAVTFTGSGLDDLTVSGIFSGTVPTTYTVTVASTGTPDTFDWTDGTNSGTGVSMSTSPTLLSNGISITFGADTGHTLTDSWTWTYSYVNQNVLDFSNNDYKFQSVLGTDTFGYQITDNILGYGITGAVNSWSNSSDFALSGLFDAEGGFGHNTLFNYGDGTDNKISLLKNSVVLQLNNSSSQKGSLIFSNISFALTNNTSSDRNGIIFNEANSGLLTIGNLSGGNGTSITIDDLNEHITISNLPAYDDDTAAGVGGLTAGMVYMTTGSGSAPLNAAGILMIKQ
jgi:hypothetical protein